jgi:ribokinase
MADGRQSGGAARVVVVGSANVDEVVRTPRLPRPGETILGGPIARHPGGKGLNQAVAAARLNAQATLVCCVGDDDGGRWLEAVMIREGVEPRLASPPAGVATGKAVITVDAGGENTIVVAPGANACLTPHHIRQAEDVIAAASFVLLQLEVPMPCVVEAARLARSNGVPVALNAAPATPLPEDLEGMLDLLIVNEHEARVLAASLSGGAGAKGGRSAETLVGRWSPCVVLTRGREGADVHDGAGVRHVAPFSVQAVDTVGAGDAFCGGLVAALSAGRALPDALRFASAAGALATTREGAVSSLPSLRDVEGLMQI